MALMRLGFPVAFALLALLTAGTASRAQDVNEAIEAAMKAAAGKVAPGVVKIETFGGTELVGGGKKAGPGGPPQPGIRKGVGPTTGVVVSPDGYIITSAFNFANKPSDISVSIPGHEKRYVGRIVANDQTRMLTLLKLLDADGIALPVPTAYPKAEIEVGRWALALGRTLDPNLAHLPSLSAGIVSAKNRIWGKAIQTDAKVSPVNYGGPLVALDGRVFGILVPASTRGEGETAGVEWYDSGIGFAIPFVDVLAALPRLKTGNDLRRGLLGVTPKSGGDMYNAPALIGGIQPDSAAAKIGLKPDDRITWLDGVPTPNYSTVMHVLGPRYEGDVIEVRVERGGKEHVFEKVTLTGTVSAVVTPFLGLLPMRDDPGPGFEIRHVYPKSPAEAAGLKAGDRIVKAGTSNMPALAAVPNRAAFVASFARLSAGSELKLEVKRKDGGKTETVTAKLTAATDAPLPAELPLPSSLKRAGEKSQAVPGKAVPGKALRGVPKKGVPKAPMPKSPSGARFHFAHQDEPKPDAPNKENAKPADTAKVEKGLLTRANAALGREYWVFVPESYDPKISHGLMVWFHDRNRGVKDAEDMVAIWGPFCEKYHFLMMGCKAQNPEGWVASETESVMQDVKTVLGQYVIDRARVLAHGMGNGGQMAFYVGFHARDTFRGVATVGAVLGTQPKDNVAAQPLSFFISGGDKDPLIAEIRASRDVLKEKKFPVVYREMKNTGKQYFLLDVFEDLQKWMDSLDRI